ncbi:MAG TPA: NUDIX hydrolase [Candidatus Baltobacteraceae bacterium]|jgi:ADP-ribose pyrophosphatase|nr:NUDIX hydrolase [Candidatus Baltobacteraceae bacterium]
MDDIPETISSRAIFDGRVFRVRSDDLRYADGHTQCVEIVEHRGSYAIVATSAPDSLVLVRQYRHAAEAMLWEIPAGVSEPGETAADGALRELREETGYRASTMRPLGSMFVTPGYCTERLEFFHADGLSSGDQQLDEDERIAVASFTIGEAERLVETGQIADVKTVVALLWMRGSRGELVPRNGR